MGQSPDSDLVSIDGNVPFMQGCKEFGEEYPHTTLFCDHCPKHSRVGDILLSVRAPVGAVNISDKVYGIGRGLCSIRAEKIDAAYLKFFIIGSREELRLRAKGSIFDAITMSDLKDFPVFVPGLEEQRAIAAFLDRKCRAVDRLIDNCQRQILLLRELQRATISEAVTGKTPSIATGG